jgi:hypothetical protein
MKQLKQYILESLSNVNKTTDDFSKSLINYIYDPYWDNDLTDKDKIEINNNSVVINGLPQGKVIIDTKSEINLAKFSEIHFKDSWFIKFDNDKDITRDWLCKDIVADGNIDIPNSNVIGPFNITANTVRFGLDSQISGKTITELSNITITTSSIAIDGAAKKINHVVLKKLNNTYRLAMSIGNKDYASIGITNLFKELLKPGFEITLSTGETMKIESYKDLMMIFSEPTYCRRFKRLLKDRSFNEIDDIIGMLGYDITGPISKITISSPIKDDCHMSFELNNKTNKWKLISISIDDMSFELNNKTNKWKLISITFS